jgi:hypothetical protein
MEGLAKAQAEIAQVRQLLLSPSPEALDQCMPFLQSAIAQINSHRLGLLKRAPDQRELNQTKLNQALQLRESTRQIGALLEGAARFHQNWIRRRNAMLCGYASDGNPAASSTRSLLAIEG